MKVSNTLAAVAAFFTLGIPLAEAARGRHPMITPAAFLAPRQGGGQCVLATDTACPDGTGCCPRGVACTYTRGNVPICDQGCGFAAVTCSRGIESGFCCPSSLTCGVSLCETTTGLFPPNVFTPAVSPTDFLFSSEPLFTALSSRPTVAPVPPATTTSFEVAIFPTSQSIPDEEPSSTSRTSESSSSSPSSSSSTSSSSDEQTTTSRPRSSTSQRQPTAAQAPTSSGGAAALAGNMGSGSAQLMSGAVAWLAALIL